MNSIGTCSKVIDSLSCFISISAVACFALDIYDRMRPFSEVSIEEKLKILRVLVLNDKQSVLGSVYLPFLCKGSEKLAENIRTHYISAGVCSSFMKNHIARVRNFLATISLAEIDNTILSFLLKRATYNAQAVTSILIPAMEFIPSILLTPQVMEVVLKQALLVTPPHSSHAEGLSRLLIESEKALRESSTVLSKTVALQNLSQLQSSGKFRRIIELAGEYFHNWYGLALLGDYYLLYKKPSAPIRIPPDERFCSRLTRLTINALLHVEDVKGMKDFLLELGQHLLPDTIASAPLENLRSVAPYVRIGAVKVFCEFCDKFKIDPLPNPVIFDHLVQALALLENSEFLQQKSSPPKTEEPHKFDNHQLGVSNTHRYHDLMLGESPISLIHLLDASRTLELLCDSPIHRQSLIRALLYQAVPRSMVGIKLPFIKLLNLLRSVDPELKTQWLGGGGGKNLYITQFQKHLNFIGDFDAAELLNYYGSEEWQSVVLTGNDHHHHHPTGNGPSFGPTRRTRHNVAEKDILLALGLPAKSVQRLSTNGGPESPPPLLWDLLFSCFTKVFMIRTGLHAPMSRFYADFRELISIETLHFHSVAVLLCSHLLLLRMNEVFEISKKWLHGYNGLKRKDLQKGKHGDSSNIKVYHKRFLSDLEILEELQSLLPIWSQFIRDFEKRTCGRPFPTNEENSLIILDLLSAMNVPVKKEIIQALTDDFLIKCPTIQDVRKTAKDLHIRLNGDQGTEVDSEIRRLLCLVLAIPPEIAHFRHRFYHYLFERKKGFLDNKSN
ncbi:hypothetical protein DI09_166p30 [Mitosporidium daphniae]|uniref:Uncharacterized protein n=1 Tax=Mitosporidium daphniae TaxID=1485682 RepID=A0A098VU77_9MICR|nr:uncharacterized protein DI09_166p30 [Mitosporidium daphniae]KGG52505.1 hypothetical protein DI09_166p30 [Mitosporidium daphniae]|eukprot:XP_013238941.1 uncharacterized protein DI09_166p30 [Mitosporidium daphniae]